MAGRRLLIVLGLATVVAVAGLSACGGDDDDRDTKVCRECHPPVDEGCFNECRELCLAGDPNCDTRCAAQCDECRRDLVCVTCRAGCTGTALRCAPSNETVQCEDGMFGGP